MTELLCPDPAFVFDHTRQCWSACVRCGRLAWTHEQSDPMADLRNFIAAAHRGEDHPNPHTPPVMRPNLPVPISGPTLEDRPGPGQETQQPESGNSNHGDDGCRGTGNA